MEGEPSGFPAPRRAQADYPPAGGQKRGKRAEFSAFVSASRIGRDKSAQKHLSFRRLVSIHVRPGTDDTGKRLRLVCLDPFQSTSVLGRTTLPALGSTVILTISIHVIF